MIFLVDFFRLLIFLLFLMNLFTLGLIEDRLFLRLFLGQGLIFYLLKGHFVKFLDLDYSIRLLPLSGSHVIDERLALTVLMSVHHGIVSLRSHVEK